RCDRQHHHVIERSFWTGRRKVRKRTLPALVATTIVVSTLPAFADAAQSLATVSPGVFDAIADSAAHAGTQPLAALIVRAESERLYEDPMWRVLGHNKDGFIAGERGHV